MLNKNMSIFFSEKCDIHITVGIRQTTVQLNIFLGLCLSWLIFKVLSTGMQTYSAIKQAKCLNEILSGMEDYG